MIELGAGQAGQTGETNNRVRVGGEAPTGEVGLEDEKSAEQAGGNEEAEGTQGCRTDMDIGEHESFSGERAVYARTECEQKPIEMRVSGGRERGGGRRDRRSCR